MIHVQLTFSFHKASFYCPVPQIVNRSVISNIKDIIYYYIADTCISVSSTRERFGWFYLEAQDIKIVGILRYSIQYPDIDDQVESWLL